MILASCLAAAAFGRRAFHEALEVDRGVLS
jgi:hypothetical protein